MSEPLRTTLSTAPSALAPKPRVMPRDVLRDAQPYIAPLLRETLTPTQQENFEAWVAHFEGRLRETPPEIVEAIRRALAAVPSESDPTETLTERAAAIIIGTTQRERGLVPSESDAGLDALREAIKADLTALAHLTPEDWDEHPGLDPIARTINAARDIVDARFAAVPSESPEEPRCSECGEREAHWKHGPGPGNGLVRHPFAAVRP